jgi:hypothetical protein
MASKEFTKDVIEPIDYYGEADALNGRHLKDGEKLKVTFPDGSKATVKIKILKEHRTAQVDMTPSPDEFTTNIAYTEVMVMGAKARINLRGMHAKRVR